MACITSARLHHSKNCFGVKPMTIADILIDTPKTRESYDTCLDFEESPSQQHCARISRSENTKTKTQTKQQNNTTTTKSFDGSIS